MEMPKINFEPLIDNSRDELIKKIYENPCVSCFLVYLRNRYQHETEWEYLIECCSLYNQNDILWFNDWYEGQQYVEYLGIAVIDVPQIWGALMFYCEICGDWMDCWNDCENCDVWKEEHTKDNEED